MRFIPPSEVELCVDPPWKEQARGLAARLSESGGGDERDGCLGEAAELWREVKPQLARASAGKCWYCETSSGRAECDVDHYRPRVACEGNPRITRATTGLQPNLRTFDCRASTAIA